MRVVVGVDGSQGAEQALAFAVQEAELRGATLEVVHALRPREAFYPYTMVGEPLPEPPTVREAAEDMLREMIATAQGPPPRCWPSAPTASTCSWSARAGAAGSPASCSGP